MGTHEMKITKDTGALEALRMSGSIIQVFQRHNLYCPGCKGISQETIEKIALCNGMDVAQFVDELNDALK